MVINLYNGSVKSVFAFFSLLLTCISAHAADKSWDEYSEKEREEAILTTAYEQGHKSNYRRDCSGYVESVLGIMGHDFPLFIRTYDVHDSGVRLIYDYVSRNGIFHENKRPKPGDLIFFSKTYDLNRDRKLNDSLTHIGIVASVDRDGTIKFVHILQKKMKTDFMNLEKPAIFEENGKILNSYLRRAQKGNRTAALSSQLFDFFGSLNP